MEKEHDSYIGFTSKARIDKAINILVGIVEGIAIDGRVNNYEVSFLASWVKEHSDLQDTHPVNELLPVVAKALTDGVISEEERLDVLWLCENLRSREYYDTITADLQRLQGIVSGIAADGIVTEAELTNLSDWLQEHDDLRTCYPYDEIDSLITIVMADQKIDAEEQKILLAAFEEFVPRGGQEQYIQPESQRSPKTLQGLCAICPAITVSGSLFCFTGESVRYVRDEMTQMVRDRGGRVTSSVSPKLNYLVIGAQGNPCWAYACYGRKVEAAIKLRKEGYRLLIVHENDFHDAVSG